MRVLVACEFSGIVRDAFISKGHDAWSCDLLPSERPGPHLQCDVLAVLQENWDLMVAHPPCTHLAVSGAAWFKHKAKEQEAALAFIRALLDAPIPRIALENPVSIINTRIRRPEQIIHPYYFGDEASKPTCLWLKNLPPLEHKPEPDLFGPATHVGKGEFAVSKSGRRGAKWNWWLPPGPDRWKIRSRTFPGIARAMAEQWGGLSARGPSRPEALAADGRRVGGGINEIIKSFNEIIISPHSSSTAGKENESARPGFGQ